MRTVRLATICLAALTAATLISGSALAKGAKPVGPPQNLRGFLLRPSEAITHAFPRTPAFAWSPVRGARCYEFELATSRRFNENAVVWSNVKYGVTQKGSCTAVPASSPAASGSSGSTSGSGSSSGTAATSDPAVTSVIRPLKVPAVSVDLALPWFTGQPYALYAHVRAITSSGATGWSKPFAFNMRWPSVPTPQQARPGLVRWSPVEGATGYQVWYPDIGKTFSTHTNVADQRDFYTFHASADWIGTIHWRVRAVRRIFGDIPNGLPAVSYGPWSPLYTATNPTPATGKLQLSLALSDRSSSAKQQYAHELMPGLTFTGTQGLDGREYGLFRAYAFTDRDCVNMVFRGSVVGSPAFAPRTTGPLKLPVNETELDKALEGVLRDAATEGATFTVEGMAIKSSESTQGSTSTGGTAAGTGGSAGAGTSIDASQTVASARVDLPDVDFPATRYYWTVVPVVIVVNEESGAFEYYDAEVPQDACAAGRTLSFGKESEPVVTSSSTPYVSGLTPGGRLLALSRKRPTLYSTPLVAWQPATGATGYEVQWSRARYPWRASGSTVTYSTSAVLDLAPGKWHYRVRGLNSLQLRKPEMPWSAPVTVTIAKPKFRVVGG